jgi:hypothetical protein
MKLLLDTGIINNSGFTIKEQWRHQYRRTEFQFAFQMSDGAILFGDIQKWTAPRASLLRQSLNPILFKPVTPVNFSLFDSMRQLS